MKMIEAEGLTKNFGELVAVNHVSFTVNKGKIFGLVTEKVILCDRLTAMENLVLLGRLNHMPEKIINERSERWLKLLQMREWQDKQGGLSCSFL
jgi:ABC-type multidrug transport system ATPase subunit